MRKIPQSVQYFIDNKYAYPGGYPMFGVMYDGACICHECTEANKDLIIENTTADIPEDKEWKIISADINYEDEHLFCEHCNKQIESAYSNDDNESE